MLELSNDANLLARLEVFFLRAAPLIRLNTADTHSIDDELGPRLQIALAQLREPLKALRDATCANVWSTAGLGTDEVRISSVLAKLWDEGQYGAEGRLFLARSLAFLGHGRTPSGDELEDGYRIQTEHCPNGEIGDRVDITVETQRSIFGIEVKILANEGERQLERYVLSIGQRAKRLRRENAQVIFLSPRAPDHKGTSAIWVTWRQIADAAALADRSTKAGSNIYDFGEFCMKLGR